MGVRMNCRLRWTVLVAVLHLPDTVTIFAPIFSVTDVCRDEDQYIQIYPSGNRECMPCRTAPPGFRVQEPCHDYSDSVIAPCPPGTFSRGGGDTCSPCSGCEPGYAVSSNCTATSDTVCQKCPENSYASSNTSCKRCKPCRPGSFVYKECGGSSNTVCRDCPRRYFSARRNQSKCLPCRTCRTFEKVLKRCSSSNDESCGDCMEGYFRHAPTDECLLCSYCYPNATFVVEECRRRTSNPDSSFLCMPAVPPLRPDTLITTQTVASEDVLMDMTSVSSAALPKITYGTSTSENTIMFISLLVILSSFLLLVVTAFLVARFEGIQRLIRRARDYKPSIYNLHVAQRPTKEQTLRLEIGMGFNTSEKERQKNGMSIRDSAYHDQDISNEGVGVGSGTKLLVISPNDMSAAGTFAAVDNVSIDIDCNSESWKTGDSDSSTPHPDPSESSGFSSGTGTGTESEGCVKLRPSSDCDMEPRTGQQHRKKRRRRRSGRKSRNVILLHNAKYCTL